MSTVNRKDRAPWRQATARSATHAAQVADAVVAAMAAAGYPDRDLFAMRLAVEEAVVNAVKHGNRGDPDRQVRVRYCVGERRALATIADEGPGFDPAGVPDPLAPENLDRPCGRGLLLIRKYATWF